jgi:hypothetical protein
MKKLLLALGILLIASQAWAYTAISPDSYISPDDVTIARMQGNQNIIVNAINNADGGNIKLGTISADSLTDDANPHFRWNEAFNDFVYTGLLPTISASLVTTTSSGTGYIEGVRVVKDATSKTYTANKWTFVDISKNGTYTYSEIAINGSTPSVASNSLRLCRVSSDTTTIAAVRDDRVMGISLSIEDQYRVGLQMSVVSPDAITVNPGIVYAGSTRIMKTANTTLSTATASDWATGISGRALSADGYVVVNNLGSIKLTPITPDYSDTAGNAVGDLRYSKIGTDYWRALSYFRMNGDGSGNIENTRATKDWQYGIFQAGKACILDPFNTSVVMTTAHGLGKAPDMVLSYYECKRTERGYVAGDRIYMNMINLNQAGGATVQWDATNVCIVTTLGTPYFVDKDTPSNGLIQLTSAYWRVVAVPYILR